MRNANNIFFPGRWVSCEEGMFFVEDHCWMPIMSLLRPIVLAGKIKFSLVSHV
jgi:hypothetical protein